MRIVQLVLLLMLTAMVSAQNKSPDQSAAYAKRLRPGPLAEVSVEIKHRQPGSQAAENVQTPRALRVYRCEQGSDMPWLYLHEPLWSFVEQSAAPAGFPSFVRRYLPNEGPNGADLIEAEVELSSREFRELVRRTILESEGELRYLEKSAIQPEKVQVICMSPLEVVLELTGPGGYTLLGTCVVKTAINWGERAALTFVLEPDTKKELMRLAQAELVSWAPTYTFVGFETGSAERTVNAERSLRLVIQQELDSEQEAGTGYVLQNDKAKIERSTSAAIRSSLRVSHREMLTAQNLSVAAPLMELLVEQDLKPEDFKALNPEKAMALAQRLVPLIKKEIESSGGDASTVSIRARENASEDSLKAGFALGVGPLVIGGGAGSKWTDRNLEQLENASGIHFEKSKESSEYVAQTARLFTMRQGWQAIELKSREVVYVTLSAGAEARSSTPVPQTFTAQAVKARAGEKVEDVLYHGVPVGTMLPFFGTTLPSGFAWADGKSNFPDDPRVPEHLRGKPVPNMNTGLIPSGPSGQPGEYIGQVMGPGSVTVQATTASGNGNFALSGESVHQWLHNNRSGYKGREASVPAVGKDVAYIPMLDNHPKFKAKERNLDNMFGNEFFYLDQLFMSLHNLNLSVIPTFSASAAGPISAAVPAQTLTLGKEARTPHVVCNWIIKVK